MQYWINRNQSKTYSKKLFSLFQKAVLLIAKYPYIGSPTEYESIRSKVVRDYQIFYKNSGDAIHILAIRDCRQDPDRLTEIFK